jgi:flagellar FliL protein
LLSLFWRGGGPRQVRLFADFLLAPIRKTGYILSLPACPAKNASPPDFAGSAEWLNPLKKSEKPPMSDTKPETTETPEAAPKRKRGLGRRLLLFAIPAILVGAGAGAAYRFVPALGDKVRGMAGLNHTAVTVAAVSHPQFIEFPEMAVTLPNAGHPRQMRIKLAVELTDAAPSSVSAEILSPRVYDALLTYLRTLRDGDVDGGLGLDRLRGDLYRRLDLVLGPGVLRDVLVTSLVLA